LYGAWSGFSTFISELMPHIGRAIYNGLNPFSDETFSDTIASGYRDAMDKARAAASSSKLIDFQFRLTPVAPTGAPAASTTGGGFQSTGGGAPAGETPAEARARANAAKARQDLLDDLSNQILLLRDQYKLETDLIGLGPIRTEQLTKQQQLKEKEAADIQKVREIEGLSAADREAAIARVKELYSTLRSETDSTVSSLVTARQAFEQQGAL
jgi:hypothetical protein